MSDPFNLQRFVEAQEREYDLVVEELRRGEQLTRWMWFVFPQVAGLGYSRMSVRYAISSLEEAQAYLEHPLLGPRLEECTRLVLQIDGATVEEIFGYPDFYKFRSCMTLFAACTPGNGIFRDALDKFFGGEPDQTTISILGGLGSGSRDS